MARKLFALLVYPFRKDPLRTRPIVARKETKASYEEAFKRLFDMVVSLLGLTLVAPLILLVALLIRLDSPGPVFYRGRRMGRGGTEFAILKFRTMYERPESYEGPAVTANGDNRITPLGRWLRDTKINELPQLWNVLVGEMSLVGPRPEDPAIAAHWPTHVRREILSVRPGITSPASVAYHDEERRLNSTDVMDDYLQHIQPDKMRLDRLYVRHHNFLTDLDAIFWTLVILVPSLGERKIREGWLFGGPFSRAVRNYLGWFFTDFLIALLSISFVGILWRLSSPLDLGMPWSVLLATLMAFLFSFYNALVGLRMVSWTRAAAEDAIRLFISAGLVILTQLSLDFTGLHGMNFPLGFILVSSVVVLVFSVIARYRLRLITGFASRWINYRHRGYGAGERVLIVGAGEGGSFAAWLLRRNDFQRRYTVVGIVDDDPAKQGMHYEGFKVLGTTADIPELARELDIEVIFYAIAKISTEDQARILAACKRTQKKLVIISDLMHSLHDHLEQGSDFIRSLAAAPFRETAQNFEAFGQD
jgi:lipopolysaccharide/colanic/teichoic acid biosynthesis glycosyltransferase